MTEFVTPGGDHIDRMFASETARSVMRGLNQALDELAREEGPPNVWTLLARLQKLQQEFDELRRQHNDLVHALRDFGQTLGLLHMTTIDEMMRTDGA